ncbi:MAG: c-type cytochrome [Burkholderiaceae bacterium]
MRMFKIASAGFLLTATALIPVSVVKAADVKAGRAKAQMMCMACHGLDGVAVLPGAANLSGQQAEYLSNQLKAYKSGRRANPQMSVVASTLTEQDIENLSAWYAAIKVTVEMPD